MALTMSVAAAATAGAVVPAGLRSTDVESSFRSCPSSSSVLMGQRKAVPLSRNLVTRASASEQEGQVWKVAKNAATAAAISFVLSSSPVQAADPNAFLQFPDNEAGAASRSILSDAKKTANESFAETQKTGQEIVGDAQKADQAAPAISQVDPNAEEASDSVGNAIAARADAAADLAPGTGQQNGKKGVNPIEKAFATPTRGFGDKEGENEARIANLGAKRNSEPIPGQTDSIGQKPGIIENIYNTFKSAGDARDKNVPAKPF